MIKLTRRAALITAAFGSITAKAMTEPGCEVLFFQRPLWPYPQAQAGDAIVIKPIGGKWGRCDLGEIVPGSPHGNHPHMRIVRFKNVPESQAGRLLGERSGLVDQYGLPFEPYRAFFLDISKATARHADLAAFWHDDSRKTPILTVDYSTAEFLELVSVRKPMEMV